jgi:membrane protein
MATFTIILGVLYYAAPNRRQRWRDVYPGALLAAMMLAPVTGLFTFYVQRIARYREFYGSVSAVVLLLIWTYLVSVVVLLGCEFNAARERRLGTLAPRTPGET